MGASSATTMAPISSCSTATCNATRPSPPTKGVQIVAFDQICPEYFGPQSQGRHEHRNCARGSAISASLPTRTPRSWRLEAPLASSARSCTTAFPRPFYPMAFAFLAVAHSGPCAHDPRKPLGAILMAAGLALGLRVSGLTASNLVTLNAAAVPLVYAIPLGAILVAALAAHVRMSPELSVQAEFPA